MKIQALKNKKGLGFFGLFAFILLFSNPAFSFDVTNRLTSVTISFNLGIKNIEEYRQTMPLMGFDPEKIHVETNIYKPLITSADFFGGQSSMFAASNELHNGLASSTSADEFFKFVSESGLDEKSYMFMEAYLGEYLNGALYDHDALSSGNVHYVSSNDVYQGLRNALVNRRFSPVGVCVNASIFAYNMAESAGIDSWIQRGSMFNDPNSKESPQGHVFTGHRLSNGEIVDNTWYLIIPTGTKCFKCALATSEMLLGTIDPLGTPIALGDEMLPFYVRSEAQDMLWNLSGFSDQLLRDSLINGLVKKEENGFSLGYKPHAQEISFREAGLEVTTIKYGNHLFGPDGTQDVIANPYMSIQGLDAQKVFYGLNITKWTRAEYQVTDFDASMHGLAIFSPESVEFSKRVYRRALYIAPEFKVSDNSLLRFGWVYESGQVRSNSKAQRRAETSMRRYSYGIGFERLLSSDRKINLGLSNEFRTYPRDFYSGSPGVWLRSDTSFVMGVSSAYSSLQANISDLSWGKSFRLDLKSDFTDWNNNVRGLTLYCQYDNSAFEGFIPDQTDCGASISFKDDQFSYNIYTGNRNQYYGESKKFRESAFFFGVNASTTF